MTKQVTTYTAIIGDSIVKDIKGKGWQLSTSVDVNDKIIVKSFSGSTTKDTKENYILPAIKKQPKRIVQGLSKKG